MFVILYFIFKTFISFIYSYINTQIHSFLHSSINFFIHQLLPHSLHSSTPTMHFINDINIIIHSSNPLFIPSINQKEMTSKLETDSYSHVLSIKTTSKNQKRTYYLAAGDDDELGRWTGKISSLLSLSEG